MLYRVPLVFEPDPVKGYTVTSPLLPELITCGDTMAEAYANVQDAMAAVIEIYEDFGRELPADLILSEPSDIFCSEAIVEAA